MSQFSHHSQQGGYSPYPQQARQGNGCSTCLIVGLVFGGLGLILVGVLAVGGIYLYSQRESAPEESTLLSDDQRAIDDARRRLEAQRQQRIAESTRPPASIEEAMRDLQTGSDARKQLAGTWLAQQSISSSDRTRLSPALNQGLAGARSDEAILAVLDAIGHCGGTTNADEVAKLLISKRDREQIVLVALGLLDRYQRDSTADEVASLLDNSDVGSTAADVLATFSAQAIESIYADIAMDDEEAVALMRRVFRNKGMNADVEMIDVCLAHLDSSQAQKRQAALAELGSLPVSTSRRAEVASALDPFIDPANGDLSDLFLALRTWGDESNTDSLIALTNESRYSNDVEFVRLIVRLENPDMMPFLATLLPTEGEVGRLAMDALEEFGEPAVPHLLSQFHSGDERARTRVEQILRSFTVEDELFINQAVEDITSSDENRVRMAAITLAEYDPIESHRDTVSTRLGDLLEDDDNYSRHRSMLLDALEVWGTEDQVDVAANLMTDRDENIWLPAFRFLMRVGAGNEIILETAEKMSNSFYRQQAIDAMKEVGSLSEQVAINMLSHNDKQVVLDMCTHLGEYGGQASLDPLRTIRNYAREHRANDVVDAADEARDEIRRRTSD